MRRRTTIPVIIAALLVPFLNVRICN